MKNLKLSSAKLMICGVLFSAGFADTALAQKRRTTAEETACYPGASHRRSNNRHRDLQAEWRKDGLQEVVLEQGKGALAKIALNALYVDLDGEIVDRYLSEDYIQHNPNGLSGRDFVKSIFIDNTPENYKADTGFMMTDGEFVLTHSRFSGFDAFYEGPIVAVDVYRVRKGKVVEHWDVVQLEVVASETVSGNPMFPIEPRYDYVSEAQEKRNAEMVRKAVTDLVGGDESAVDKYFSEDYIQHNPSAPNGTDALRGFAAAGLDLEVGFVVADGPYVAVQSRAAGIGDTAVIVFDIFRIEDDLIVEHWDVVQDEVPVELTASGNPMFPIE